jgi:hypothetical protein
MDRRVCSPIMEHSLLPQVHLRDHRREGPRGSVDGGYLAVDPSTNGPRGLPEVVVVILLIFLHMSIGHVSNTLSHFGTSYDRVSVKVDMKFGKSVLSHPIGG